MLSKVICSSVIFIFFCSCTNKSAEPDTATDVLSQNIAVTEVIWPTGNFMDTTVISGRVSYCENWTKISQNSWEGEKYQIRAGDTSSPTKLTLTKTDGKYYYSILEEESQITFVQDSINKGYLSFVNTQDNFPTNLIYKWNNSNLIISFSGVAKGIVRNASFNTYKVKD